MEDVDVRDVDELEEDKGKGISEIKNISSQGKPSKKQIFTYKLNWKELILMK